METRYYTAKKGCQHAAGLVIDADQILSRQANLQPPKPASAVGDKGEET